MRNALPRNVRARHGRRVPAALVWSIACTTIAASALAATSPAHAQQVLRWKLKAGDVLNYKSEQQMKMTSKSMGRQRKQTRTQVVYFQWKVTSVSDAGVADITQKINRLTVHVELPPFLPFDFDSSTPSTDIPEPFEPEAQQLKATVGAEIAFHLKPSGEFENIRIPEQTMKALREALSGDAAGQGSFTEQGLKDQLAQTTPPSFPTEPLEPGKTWSSKPAKIKTALGTITSDKVFTFHGPDPNTPKLVVIGMETRTALEPAENLTVKIRSQEGKGSLTFDTELGRVVATRTSQKMDISIAKDGQMEDQTSDTTSSWTLEP